ncbi:hypothetical protein KO488_04690, partial [Poseidonibacter lekithochrous]|uniref:Calx-beta domain-containing protein n=1 Tax=Poseidonibacter TaxID=2321187 RepID=UPI0026E494C6
MATIAGTIKSLSNGIFKVKDENGNVRELKVGDEIYENDTVYGDSGNLSSSQVEIQLSGDDVIVLNEGEKQFIDATLIETAFGTEELFFTRESLDLKLENHNADADVISDLRDAEFTEENLNAEEDGSFADANDADATEEETAEGEEEVEDEATVEGQFQARTGDATDINSDLRNAQFRARTQTFEDKSAFENESTDRLTSLENTDRPSYTTPPSNPITNPGTPTRPESGGPTENVTPPTIVTPPVTPPTVVVPPVISNLSVNDISAYESEGFLVFTVTLDEPNSSDITFDYVTSPLTATNSGVDYTDVSGTITIPAGSTSITIKVPITEDYISDNGETMQIDISNVVGNANITKPVGIGTILDNTEENNSIYAIIVGPDEVIEGNTTTEYTVKLVDIDGNPVIVTKETEVTVIYKNITTQNEDTEYNDGNTITITIPANSSSNTFTVDTIDDNIADNGENYNLEITNVEDTGDFEDVVIGDKDGNFKDVTTTIIDNSKNSPEDPYDETTTPPVESDLDAITVKLFAIDGNGNRVPANEVLEGNEASYIAVAFDKNGNEILQGETVEVTFGKTGDSATADVDYDATTQTVTIGTIFKTPTIDDYIADNGEVYSVQITDKTLSNASIYETVIIDTTPVNTTILDDSQPSTPNNPGDPEEPNMESVVVKLVSTDAQGNIIPEATIPEGETAYYKAILVDPNGNQITNATGDVDITFTDGTAIRTGTVEEGKNDFTATNATVTLNEVFSAVAKDDYIADSGETFNVQITDDTYSNADAYENVEHDTTPVVTTITDNLAGIEKPVEPGNPETPDNPNTPVYGSEDTVYV